MEEKPRTDTLRFVKNPLLSVAGGGFPLNSFSGSALLVPVSENCPSVLPDDVAAEDHFIGQDATPTSVQSASAFDVDLREPSEDSQQPPQDQFLKSDPATSALAGLSSSFTALTASLPSAFSFFSGAAPEPPATETTPPPPVHQPPLLPPPLPVDVDNAPGLETVPLDTSSPSPPVFFNPAAFQLQSTTSGAVGSVAHPTASVYAKTVSLAPPSDAPPPAAPPATTHWGIQPILSDPQPPKPPTTSSAQSVSRPALQSIGTFFTGASNPQQPPTHNSRHSPGQPSMPLGSTPAPTPPLIKDNYNLRNSPTPTGPPHSGPPPFWTPGSTPPLIKDNYNLRNSPTPTGPPPSGPPPTGPPTGGPKSFSLGGHRRPTYAPVPGLLLSSSTQPMATAVAPGLAPFGQPANTTPFAAAQFEASPYPSPFLGSAGGPSVFAPPPSKTPPSFGQPLRSLGSPSLSTGPAFYEGPPSVTPPTSIAPPPSTGASFFHPSPIPPSRSQFAPPSETRKAPPSQTLFALSPSPPSSVAPPLSVIAPSSSSIAPPPSSIAPPPSSIAPPPSSIAPPPSSIAPPPSSIAPPPSSIAPPPSSIAPPPSSIAPPPSSIAPPPSSIAPPPSSIAPPPSSIAPPSTSIAPPPSSIAPPPSSIAPPPSSIAPPSTSIAPPPSSIASPPPSTSIAPPSSAIALPPSSVASPLSSIASELSSFTASAPHSSAASYFEAPPTSSQPQPFVQSSAFTPTGSSAHSVLGHSQVSGDHSFFSDLPAASTSAFASNLFGAQPTKTAFPGPAATSNPAESGGPTLSGTESAGPRSQPVAPSKSLSGTLSELAPRVAGTKPSKSTCPPTNVTATEGGLPWIIDPTQFSGTPRNFDPARQVLAEMAPGQNGSSILDCTQYRPVYCHWFYREETTRKVQWRPFSMKDSLALEAAFKTQKLDPETVVATNGGRYDVNLLARTRTAVYWEEPIGTVRRCSWFYKADTSLVPYEESVALRLEEEFKTAMATGQWQRRVKFSDDEMIIIYSPHALYHCMSTTASDAWGNVPQSPTRSRAVKRGVEDFVIPEGEPDTVDHLLFLVQGIGSACDLKFRGLIEVVDDFRNMALQLTDSHFSEAVRSDKAHRIEVLPISWHAKLHGSETGIDERLSNITLPSVPKMRHLANDAIADVLFYTSPVYCQTIVQTVGSELNRLHDLFLKRNPEFNGGVSVSGHSLGSLILFDLLCHQKAPNLKHRKTHLSNNSLSENDSKLRLDDAQEDEFSDDQNEEGPSLPSGKKKSLSRRISYVMFGPLGAGQPYITYPQLNFHPRNFFAYGSPIGIFVTVRGIESLGEDFVLPTCPSFFNIFHPCDLVAYRIESLIRSDMARVRPVLIPHHKGRKRMHLELKETMARMGADIKQRVLDSVYNTWSTVCQLSMFHKNEQLQHDMNQAIEDEIWELGAKKNGSTALTERDADPNVKVGKLNGGRRVDYVLQETPLESFNEYISATYSHVCYWTSEDTTLMTLKEIYATAGITADRQLPQENVIPPMGSAKNSPSPQIVESISLSPNSSQSASRSSP